MNKKALGLFLSALFASNAGSAFAARFPNAVEKTIAFAGKDCAKIGELLGVSSGVPTAYYPLGRGDAWAVYLLKQDTKVPLYNDNEGSPTRINRVDLSAKGITIAPYWLDLGSRGPKPEPGSFSFSSPDFSCNDDNTASWVHMLNRLRKEPQWRDGNEKPYERQFLLADGKRLAVDVWLKGKNLYSITITFRA